MNNIKNKKYLLFSLCFIVILGIIFIPNVKKNNKGIGSNRYATAQIEGFEMSLFGSTGWAAIDLPLKESASSSSNTVATVSEGTPFLILGQNGNYWEIKYNDYHGYIDYNYCLINLPDVVPSIKYNIVNSYSAIYKSSGYNIDGATGETLYGTNCSNGLCQKIDDNGKVMNNKIGRFEHIVPMLYSTSLKVAHAQTLSLNDGYSLMIYDTYRPRSVSIYVAQKLDALYKKEPVVKNNIDSWGQDWFLAQGVSKHNVGVALDVSLWDINAQKEVDDMPTAMHELSTAAIKYESPGSSKYSAGMENSESAKKLDQYMNNVGMNTLASEWWHFQENAAFDRMKSKTNNQGMDFQVTSIASTFGFTGNLTTAGDVNGDGFINEADAELIYNLYKFLQTNTCDTCGNLIHYSDFNNNNQLDLDDVYSILNLNNDLISSSMYSITDSYIYAGVNTFSSQNVTLKNIQGLSLDVDNENNKVLIKYHGDLIKEYDIVSYSYSGHDLTKPYIFSQNGIQEINANTASHKFKCVNCVIDVDLNNSKVYIKKDSNDQQNLAEYDLVYFTSDYVITDSSIEVNAPDIKAFLDGINFVNCEGYIKDGGNIRNVGNFIGGEKFVVRKDSETLKRYDLIFKTNDIVLSKKLLNLELDQERTSKLSADIIPNYATNKNFTWESSNPSVATVDQNGLVTAVGVGNTTITVTTEDGESYDDCNVSVVEYFEFVVTYINNGNGFTQNYKAGQNVIVNDIKSNKDGYRIVGWKYDGHDYNLTDTLSMPRQDITLEAIYEPIPSITDYDIETIGGINYIKDIHLKTDLSQFSLNLDSGKTFKIYDGDSIKTTGNIGTGNVIKIFDDNELVESYTVSIKGDINGDGDISVSDVSMIYKKLKRKTEFSDAQSIASNVNADDSISVSDISMIYKHIKHKVNISGN